MNSIASPSLFGSGTTGRAPPPAMGDLATQLVSLLRQLSRAPVDAQADLAGQLLASLPGLRGAVEQAMTPVERGQFAAVLDSTPEQGQATHVVRQGDTLSDIAERYGTSWQALARANGISNPDLIRPGQRLLVPSDGSTRYVVRAGDTLGEIAERFGTSWQQLARANGLANPDRIMPGQELTIPGAKTTAPAPPTASPLPVQTPVSPSPTPVLQQGTPVGASGMSEAGLDALYRREALAGVSNRLHWPGGASGVTLGPGYDLRYRQQADVVRDLTAIGVAPETAAAVARGVGLSGADARNFAAANRDLIDLTAAEERQLLDRTVTPYADAVRSAVTVPITQNQYDALVSFAYNIGTDSFRGSTALRRLNAGDMAGAAEAMGWWNKSDGQVVQGLVNRRADEVRQFNTPGPAFSPVVPPTVPAQTGASTNPQTAAEVAALVHDRGDATARADLDAGRRVVVALRTDTNVRDTPNGRYDDRMIVVWKDAAGQFRMEEFRGNTEPSGQYRYDGAKGYRGYGVDMNGDGRPELGRLLEGSYRYSLQDGQFLGNRYFRPDRTTAVERDTNGDGIFDSRDANRIDNSGGGRSFLIHTGGASNSWSAGCQTLPPDAFNAFLAALGGQRQFSYVLVGSQ